MTNYNTNIFTERFAGLKIEESAKKLSVNEEINKGLNNYLNKIVTFIDLTTLEGSDTFDRVKALCDKAKKPSLDKNIPSVAAVCIYPRFIKFVKENLANTGINTASVSTSFPSGQVPLFLKLDEVKYCVDEGADEIDMVISRGEFLSGNYNFVADEISKIKELCAPANVHLKVILETGELKTFENIYLASVMAIDSGADFIKTSTGKMNPAATLEAAYIMLTAIKDYYEKTKKKIGFKPAGGIRKAEESISYLSLVKNILGDEWCNNKLFRIGASSLLDDVVNKL